MNIEEASQLNNETQEDNQCQTTPIKNESELNGTKPKSKCIKII
jgi:hypothetical protein